MFGVQLFLFIKNSKCFYIDITFITHVKQHSPSLSLQESKCGYAIILMTLYCFTECVPATCHPVPHDGIIETSQVFPVLSFFLLQIK